MIKLLNSFKLLTALSILIASPLVMAQANEQSTTSEPSNAERMEAAPKNVVVKQHTDAVPTAEEDAKINKSIQDWISKSKVLSKLNIDVTTNQGIVTLKGNVNSDSEAAALVELATSIIGVRDVDTSNLTVKGSSQPMADTWITAKAKGILIREEIFGNRDVAPTRVVVETKDGVVYLTGTVDNHEQINNAVNLIKTIQGVKQVVYKFSKVLPTTPSNHNANTENQNNTHENNSEKTY